MVDRRYYVEARATRNMRALPRFGHPSIFAMAFGTVEQRQDYLYGLLFGGIFIISFFLLWTILVGVFKCLGEKKVGMLSGSAIKSSYSTRAVWVRSSFLVAAVILVVYAVVLVTKGLTQLETGIGTVHESSVAADYLVQEAHELVDNLGVVAEEAIPLQQQLLDYLQDEFCSNYFNQDETFANLTQDTYTHLLQVGNYTTQIDELSHALDKASQTSEQAITTTDNIAIDDWQSLIIIVPFCIFCTNMAFGVILAWRRRSHKWFICFLSWIVLPLFVLLIIASYFLSGAIAIGASANADFCSGGQDNTPQSSIKEIARVKGYSQDDLVVRIIDFYANACSMGNPFGFLEEHKAELEAVFVSLTQLNAAILNTTVDNLEELCAGDEVEGFADLILAMNQSLQVLIATAGRALELLACTTIFPIFTNAFWDGTCNYSVKGATWTFASFLVIAMMGMLLISLRSAWLPLENDDDDKLDTASSMEVLSEQEVEHDQPLSSAERSPEEEDHVLMNEDDEDEDEDDATFGNVEGVAGIAARNDAGEDDSSNKSAAETQAPSSQGELA